MFSYRPSEGDVLHIGETGPRHDRGRGHYFIVLTEPFEGEKCLLVPICTAHSKCDRTCLLDSNDHDCLHHESFVLYAQLKFYSTSHIAEQAVSGQIEVMTSLRAELLTKVVEGVHTSSLSPLLYKKYLSRFAEWRAANSPSTDERSAD